MNLKANLVIGVFLLLAIIFVPFVPNDAPMNCDNLNDTNIDCDSSVGYVSVYTKYLK